MNQRTSDLDFLHVGPNTNHNHRLPEIESRGHRSKAKVKVRAQMCAVRVPVGYILRWL